MCSHVMQNGGGMHYGAGGAFPGAGEHMAYGQASFSGPPSPGNMSTVGSAAKDGEKAQRAGSPRPQSPSEDSLEGSEGQEALACETQTQRQPEKSQPHTAGANLEDCVFYVRLLLLLIPSREGPLSTYTRDMPVNLDILGI